MLPSDANLIADIRCGVHHLQQQSYWYNEQALLRILWLMASGQVEGCSAYAVEHQVREVRKHAASMKKALEAVS